MCAMVGRGLQLTKADNKVKNLTHWLSDALRLSYQSSSWCVFSLSANIDCQDVMISHLIDDQNVIGFTVEITECFDLFNEIMSVHNIDLITSLSSPVFFTTSFPLALITSLSSPVFFTTSFPLALITSLSSPVFFTTSFPLALICLVFFTMTFSPLALICSAFE